MLDGEVREEIFDWPEDAAKTEANGGLQKRSEAVCHKNECGYISGKCIDFTRMSFVVT